MVESLIHLGSMPNLSYVLAIFSFLMTLEFVSLSFAILSLSVASTLWILFSFAALNLITAFLFYKKLSRSLSSHLGALTDTADKMAEELKNSVGRRLQAEHLSEVKTRFLANMSHEIRTPLGSMMGFARLLESEGLKQSERMKYLSIIQKAGENLSGVVNDILDISKIESGHITVESSDVSMVEILEDLQRLLEQRCVEKGIELAIYKDRNMPDHAHTDALRLRQILLNVLSNAIKFTEQGRVSLDARRVGDALIFDIRDTGIGITEHARHVIFEPFEQGDSDHTRRYGGTGLGIPLSKHFAELLGGDLILVSSQSGIGSHFQVKVRYVQVKEMNRDRSEARQRNGVDIRGMKILAVDDAEDNRYLLEVLLNGQGCEVALAEDGKEAITKALVEDYDVILMDLQMPVMGGMEAVRVLRSRGIVTPIVALTARAMTEDSEECMASGFSDFLSKPIKMERLMDVLGGFCRQNDRKTSNPAVIHLHSI